MISLLLDNAMKYSSEQGIIRIALKTSGKNKIITVWNTTDQIEKGKLDMLFERFYRMDASHNSKTGGFGIGLSVVYAIVKAHKAKSQPKARTENQSYLPWHCSVWLPPLSRLLSKCKAME